MAVLRAAVTALFSVFGMSILMFCSLGVFADAPGKDLAAVSSLVTTSLAFVTSSCHFLMMAGSVLLELRDCCLEISFLISSTTAMLASNAAPSSVLGSPLPSLAELCCIRRFLSSQVRPSVVVSEPVATSVFLAWSLNLLQSGPWLGPDVRYAWRDVMKGDRSGAATYAGSVSGVWSGNCKVGVWSGMAGSRSAFAMTGAPGAFRAPFLPACARAPAADFMAAMGLDAFIIAGKACAMMDWPAVVMAVRAPMAQDSQAVFFFSP